MNGWILLIEAGKDEWAVIGALDVADVLLAPDPERPDMPFAARVMVETPAPYRPATCWAFDNIDDAQAGAYWLESRGYAIRKEFFEGMVVL